MDRSAPYSVSILWLGTEPQIRASCKAKLITHALFGSYDHLGKGKSSSRDMGWLALCETEIREEKRKGTVKNM